MSIRIGVRVNVPESIRRGKPSREVAVVTASDADLAALSAEDRELLAAHTGTSPYVGDGWRGEKVDAALCAPNTCNGWVTVPEPTLLGMLAGARADLAAREKAARDRAEVEAREKAERRERTLAVLAARKTSECVDTLYAWRGKDGAIRFGDWPALCGEIREGRDGLPNVRTKVVTPDWPYLGDSDVRESAEAVAWVAELKAANDAARAAAEKELADKLAVVERDRAAALARKEAGTVTLREWALAHGSDLLRARIEDGYEWVGKAEVEYAEALLREIGLNPADSAAAPGGYDHEKTSDRTTPTLEEIRFMRDLRQRIGDRPISSELNWVKYAPASGDDYDGDAEPIQRAEAFVVVTCPTGSSRQWEFAVPAEQPTA